MIQANRLAVIGAGAIGRTHAAPIQPKPELALAGMTELASAVSGQAIACTLAP